MKTVLLLEDDKEFANKCIEILLADKYEIKYAENAEKAKMILLENHIDILIIDLMLPPSYNIEGIDFFKYAKSINENIKAIFITSKSFRTTEIVAEAMKLGATDFLDKENILFNDKLIFTLKHTNRKIKTNTSNDMKNTVIIILIYSLLFIILFGFLILGSYLITLIGLPFTEVFLLITGVTISLIIIIIASQLLNESKISEKTWNNILKNRITNFPMQILELFKK